MRRLESARAKLKRAHYHLQQLKNEIKSDGENSVYGFSFRHESQTDELVIKAVMPRDVFIRYSIQASEIVSHARSALDHAVWEMVPVASRSRRTGFPVYKLEADYDRNVSDKIDGINANAATKIRTVQPFGPDPHTNLLYVLNELWNIDKHRLLATCVAYPQIMALIYKSSDGTVDASKFVNVPPDVQDGTELFRERHPGSGVTVEGEGAISSVRFTDVMLGVDGNTVDQFLTELVKFSESTIDEM